HNPQRPNSSLNRYDPLSKWRYSIHPFTIPTKEPRNRFPRGMASHLSVRGALWWEFSCPDSRGWTYRLLVDQWSGNSLVKRAIIENFILPIIDNIVARGTSLMAAIYDPKSKHDDTDLVIYQAKVRDCENTIENILTAQNSPARISRIGKVSKGGLIIEAPTDADLQALEAEIYCLPNLEDRFCVSRPNRRQP
ncbi:hypothetical protein AVEN_241469-1, partial [Araneus ventricosus]